MAAWWTVSSISRKPPGCAQSPLPGSMPRRISTISPASVIGRVVTTRRGLTYATWPQASHWSRSRLLSRHRPKRNGEPQRANRSVAASDGAAADRGPWSAGQVETPRIRYRGDDHADICLQPRARSRADGHPGESEQTLRPIDRHPGPGRSPDAHDGVGGRQHDERRLAMTTHSLTSGLPSDAPSSRAVMAIAPQMSTMTLRLM